MDTYTINNEIRPYNGHVEKPETLISKTRIYLYFALALIISGVVTLFYPYLLESVLDNSEEGYFSLVYASIAVPTIFILFSGIIMSMSVGYVKIGKKPIFMGILFLLYSISIGMLLGTLLSFLMKEGSSDTTRILSASFIISGALFILCGVISGIVKNMNRLFSILFPLSLGILTLILVNIFLQSSVVEWVVSIFLFIYILGITTYDFHMINRIANRSSIFNKEALALYCAFSIYTDFIALFLRVAMILFAFSKRN